MNTVSSKTTQKATESHLKKYRTHSAIARKVVAFQELINLSDKKSGREAAALLEVPNSTMQSWQKHISSQEGSKKLEEFFSTPVGAEFLQKTVMSVMKLMKCGPGGIRGMQEFLRNSGLDQFVASSQGAIQEFWVRCETHLLEFGKNEEERLAAQMKERKITVGLDEMFRGKRPCLVAIEVVSNYILLEKFTEDRTAETWKKELEPRLTDVHAKMDQVVSDLCGAIRLVAKSSDATHSPDVFHGLYEISKATGGALSSQERAAEQDLKKAEEDLQKHMAKPQRITAEDKANQKQKQIDLECTRDFFKERYEEKRKRREEVQEAKKELGKIYHPIDLATGKIQSAIVVIKKIAKQFEVIKSRAKAAGLSGSSIDRINKAYRAFVLMGSYLRSFFVFFIAFVMSMKLTLEERRFFKDIVFPLAYIEMIWKRLPKKEKERLWTVLQELQKKFKNASMNEECKEALMRRGKEAAEHFQRSSSCVEGRTGNLSLNYHKFHRLSARSLKVLSIVQNFDSQRSDGTTAAERFFKAKHKNLFASLVENVRIPGRAQRQHHDLKKRLEGREKRHIA
jgi:hypothetical protein